VLDKKGIVYYNEERKLKRQKHPSGIPYNVIDQLSTKKLNIDKFISTSYNYDDSEIYNLENYLKHKGVLKNNKKVFCWFTPHHLSHLFKAYVQSGFKTARVFVIDGKGSDWYTTNKHQTYETTSIYDITPNSVLCIYKNLYSRELLNNEEINPEYNPNQNKSYTIVKPPLVNKDTKFNISSNLDLGNFYSEVSRKFNFEYEEGKFMGYQSYGTPNKYINVLDIPNLKTDHDTAASCQRYFEETYSKLVERFKQNNMIFTGGTALNVVNNYKIQKKFKDCNLYFEPVCGDEGNSIGAAYSILYSREEKITPCKNIYIGEEVKDIDQSMLKDTTMKNVISLLNKGNVVGLVQGRAEAGPRALGNRSLLLDPTLKTAKKIMNDIKKREWFRPFACSILEEEADNYFYMQGIKKTPHMMHAPVAKLKAKNRIFSLIHTDNTCRVQTVNEKDNSVLYKLLKNFKVPVLMNTSFNLAGYPMVETFKDILHMVKNSSLKYVYFSDYNKILIDEKKRKNDEEKR
jgi:carbamoyltransferase